MHSHATNDDQDALVPERRHRLPQPVMRVGVVAVEQADLHDRHLQRVGLRVEGHGEGGEDAVVEAALHALGLQACGADTGYCAFG